jgi:hypothetical protein
MGRLRGGAARWLPILMVVFLCLAACSNGGTASDAGLDGVLDGEDGGGDQPALSYPLKIAFLIDCSGSMGGMDEAGRRSEAVREVVLMLQDTPDVSFDVIRFNSAPPSLTGGLGTLTGDEAPVFGVDGLLQADSMTDLQGALSRAYQDGPPSPVCSACVSSPHSDPLYDPDCHRTRNLVCRADGALIDLDALTPEMLPYLQDGQDYNQEASLLEVVEDLRGLGTTFHLGELRLHTVLLTCRDENGDPAIPNCADVEQAFHIDVAALRDLLTRLASAGGGSISEVTSGTNFGFLDLDLAPLGP